MWMTVCAFSEGGFHQWVIGALCRPLVVCVFCGVCARAMFAGSNSLCSWSALLVLGRSSWVALTPWGWLCAAARGAAGFLACPWLLGCSQKCCWLAPACPCRERLACRQDLIVPGGATLALYPSTIPCQHTLLCSACYGPRPVPCHAAALSAWPMPMLLP